MPKIYLCAFLIIIIKKNETLCSLFLGTNLSFFYKIAKLLFEK